VKKASRILVLVLATLVAVVVARAGADAWAATDDVLSVSLGDVVQVDGAPVACRVTRLARYGNRVFLDCRRAGRLAGSYGTYFGEREVLVVKFVGPRKAKTVLRARHESGVGRCT
jgi:hypothetical protein